MDNIFSMLFKYQELFHESLNYAFKIVKTLTFCSNCMKDNTSHLHFHLQSSIQKLLENEQKLQAKII